LILLIGQDNQKTPPLYYVENGEDLGVSKTFRILYRHEEILLDDIILFKAHVLVDSQKVITYTYKPFTIILICTSISIY